ncbi:MAG: prepilin-type N-terminal cleavage/methylation domain-containing protein [Opitutales bacterium]|nr:prepilin-type N-terminal cleavage/methylation domain-containing protein [Opitutales bacterium]MCH8539723.1 prepilin-type N-terminal cleavage/methylation domain-containing protein [Opitutales bacterium]
MKTSPGPSAFSLVEIISVLVLLGILGAFASFFVSSAVQRYTLERITIRHNQQVEIALARMVKELQWAEALSDNPGNIRLDWESLHPNRNGEALALAWDSTEETLFLETAGTPHVLLEGVTDFQIFLVGDSVRLNTLTTAIRINPDAPQIQRFSLPAPVNITPLSSE